MGIDYLAQSEKYKPENIGLKTRTILVAEAPPSNGKSYFYLPKKMSQYNDIKYARTLSHTIFYHYFKKIPSTPEEYGYFLIELQKRGIFMIDICDYPISISTRRDGINQSNLQKYIINNIPVLRDKIKGRGIDIMEENIVFLDPSHGYHKELKKEFPNSKIFKWIEFRIK